MPVSKSNWEFPQFFLFTCELGAPAQLMPPSGTPLFSLGSTGGYTYFAVVDCAEKPGLRYGFNYGPYG